MERLLKVGDIVQHKKIFTDNIGIIVSDTPTGLWNIKRPNGKLGSWDKHNVKLYELKLGDYVYHFDWPSEKGCITGEITSSPGTGNPDYWKIITPDGSRTNWFKSYTRLDMIKPEELLYPKTSHITDPVNNGKLIITPYEEKKMATPIIEHITQINGVNIAEMTASDILHHIGNTEARLEKLKKHKDKSLYVIQEKKRLKAFVIEAYNILDENFADPKESK